jgi:hypothetical protein
LSAMNLPPIRASHDNISSPVASTNVTSDKFTTSRGGIFVCVTRSLVSLANGPTNRPCNRMVKVSPTSSNSTRSNGGLQSHSRSFNLFRGAFSISPHKESAPGMPSEGGVSCCSHRSLDEARVFAMPCSGQCPNVGMVEDSQGSTWPARLARTLPAINWAIEQRHDAKGAEYTKKMKPGFRGRDLGFANWWNCRVLDYWSLPTVSSVETGLR